MRTQLLVLLGAALVMPAAAQVQNITARDLAVFEQFIERPGSRVAWSKVTGRIESQQVSAEVAAVVVDHTESNQEMRGVRLRLTAPGATDQVFVEEKFLAAMVESFAEVERDGQGFLDRAKTASSCHGSCIFLNAIRQGAHIVSPSVCSLADGFRGLTMGPGNSIYRFPGLTPAPFREALSRAAEELAKRPAQREQ